MLLLLLLIVAQGAPAPPLDPAVLAARSAWVDAGELEPKAHDEFTKAWRAALPEVRLVSSAQEADVIVTLGAAHEKGGTYLSGGTLIIAQVPQDWTVRVRTRLGTEPLYEDTEAIGTQRYGGLKTLVQRLADRRKGS
jgi:hypothetical protein